MPRIAVCDENEFDAEELKKMLIESIESIYFESPSDFQITVFCSSKDLIKDLDFDIIFINPEENSSVEGLKAAEVIRKMFKGTYICLVSESEKYAFAGYDIYASGYLLKPVNKEKLESYLNVILSLLLITPGSIGVLHRGNAIRINPDKIIFVESRAREVIFHLEKDIITVMGKLDKYASFLSLDFRFLRCHKSYLVNLNFVDEIKNYFVILKNGQTVPIPKAYYRAVRLRYLMFRRREALVKMQ